jgi:hypothetical protein
MKRKLVVLVVVLVLAMGLAPAVRATKPDGPVTIKTEISFPAFSGTFDVTEGADILGCSEGSFEDILYGAPHSSAANRKVFHCGDGGEGDFTLIFNPGWSPDAHGHWVVWKGTVDFAGLRGEGDFSLEFDPETLTAFETFTGVLHSHP